MNRELRELFRGWCMQSIDLIGAILELYLTVVEDAWKKSKILYEDLGIEKCFNFKKTIFQNSLKRVGENEREILESCYFLFSLNISGFCWKEWNVYFSRTLMKGVNEIGI